METVWVAAEEKHRKEKEEGRVKDEKKALKKKKKSRKALKKQVKRFTVGRKLIYSWVHFRGQAARIVVPGLLPQWKMRMFLMKTVGAFLRISTTCWIEAGRAPHQPHSHVSF